ncbi:hypothetical protein ACIRRA_43460 [Nocardia sp. NPDC101769]|uniref:hypothetical protein n=1 Tax=Nocardia sp. NPDC101769 TaxID=3364333 RepID=UPI003804DA0B
MVRHRRAEELGERVLLIVVEVVPSAEKDHLVCQQRLVDGLYHGRAQIGAQPHPIDVQTKFVNAPCAHVRLL